MSLFDSFLDTASKAFDWLSNNKAALDLVSGAAKGYGAYMDYKQKQDMVDFQKKQYEDQQRREENNSAAPNAYSNAVPMSSFQQGGLLAGSMANAAQAGKVV